MNSTTPDDADREVGDRIREARRAAGMTQGMLAQAIGVSRSAVAQWETGRSGQLRNNLTRIGAILGIPAAYLMEGEQGLDAARGDVVAENAPEMALLRLYRACDEVDQQLLLRTARRLARSESGGGDGGLDDV